MMSSQPVKPLMLNVIDREGIVLGFIPARVGLKTYSGEVTRISEKSVWCQGKSGAVQMYRESDGRLPCVYKSYAPKAEVTWIGK
jgi:hypothetical protein